MIRVPETARKIAVVISGGGPETTQTRARACAVDLHSAAQKAIPIVGEVTGLEAETRRAANTPVYVTDRPSWAYAASTSIMNMAALADNECGGSSFTRMMGVAVAGAAAVLSRFVLGQFDPYSDGERLLLNAPNIASFRDKYDLDQRDLCLWVCVHEVTHAVQYQAAPWLKDFIVHCFAHILSEEENDARVHSDNPLESEIGKKLIAVMSVLEGHAEYAMNAVSIMQMPGKRRIVCAMARRRAEKHPIKGRLMALLSMDKKMEQYRVGSAFVEHIIKAVGTEKFNQIWRSASMMPSLEELKNPQAWIERCLPEESASAVAGHTSESPLEQSAVLCTQSAADLHPQEKDTSDVPSDSLQERR